MLLVCWNRKLAHHGATETSRISKLALLIKSIVIIVGNPLVRIPGYPFHHCFFVPDRLDVFLGDNILDLLEIKDPTRTGAWTFVGATRELANTIWCIA